MKRRRGEGAAENRRLDPARLGRGFHSGKGVCHRSVSETPRGRRLGQVVAPGRKRMVRVEVSDSLRPDVEQ